MSARTAVADHSAPAPVETPARGIPEPDMEFTMQPDQIDAAMAYEACVAAEDRAARLGLGVTLAGVGTLGLIVTIAVRAILRGLS